MKAKMILMSAAAIAVMTSAAFAGASTGTSALDDPQKMSPFFTDAGMKTMRSGDEFKKAWMALTDEDRASMKKDCADETIAKSHDEFCKATRDLAGAN